MGAIRWVSGNHNRSRAGIRIQAATISDGAFAGSSGGAGRPTYFASIAPIKHQRMIDQRMVPPIFRVIRPSRWLPSPPKLFGGEGSQCWWSVQNMGGTIRQIVSTPTGWFHISPGCSAAEPRER